MTWDSFNNREFLNGPANYLFCGLYEGCACNDPPELLTGFIPYCEDGGIYNIMIPTGITLNISSKKSNRF
jgi:hypothetical protein